MIGKDEVIEEAFGVGRRALEMTFQCQLVLRFTRDTPLPGHQLTVLPHGQASSRFAVGGRLRSQLGEAESLESLQSGRQAACLAESGQAPGEAWMQYQRHIAGGIGPRGDGAVDLS